MGEVGEGLEPRFSGRDAFSAEDAATRKSGREERRKTFSVMLPFVILVVFIDLGLLGVVPLTPSSSQTASGTPTIAYVPHAVITINGDADFAQKAIDNSWPGDGSSGNPYIISGYEIDGSAYRDAITIGNTTVYFVLQGCYLHNSAEAGLLLYRVQNGTVRDSNLSYNAPYGAMVYSSSYCSFANNSFQGNSYGISLMSANAIGVANCNFTSNSAGISLSYSSNCIIVDNSFTGSGWRIGLGQSTNNLIQRNNCSYSSNHGIVLMASSTGNTIEENMCTHNAGSGIYMESGGNAVHGNNCSFNAGDGVEGNMASGGTYTENTCLWNGGNGLDLGSPYAATIANNTCVQNAFSGITVHYSYATHDYGSVVDNICVRNMDHGIFFTGLSLDQVHKYYVYRNNCSDNADCGIYASLANTITISDNRLVSNGMHGIGMFGTGSITLSNNNISWNGLNGVDMVRADAHEIWYPTSNVISSNTVVSNARYGVGLASGVTNTIQQNLLSGNCRGAIYVTGSSGTSVSQNTLSDNNKTGILIDNSTLSTLRSNVMTREGVMLTGDAIGQWGLQDIDASNTVNGRPVYYLADGVANVIPDSRGQIILANCRLMTIAQVTFENSTVAIEMGFCNNITITNVTLQYNLLGIYLKSSVYNDINGNLFAYSQGYAAKLVSGSTNNKIWNNTFVGNNGATSTFGPAHIQAYDAGGGNAWNGPSAGNYWNDWLTPDSNSDGIVDVPYDIAGPAAAEDLYPLTTRPSDPIPEFGGLGIVVALMALTMLAWASRYERKRREVV